MAIEDPTPRRDPFVDFLWRLYCYLLVLFALYVLSAGPMYWVVYEAYFLEGDPFVGQLYLPLVWASEIGPIGRFLEWYVGLWIF